MNIFDIMGPVMVGPSSSHTAGAVRIGLITRHLLGSQPVSAQLLLHGSFAATGKGHGTDRALVAGLLDMAPDDPRIPRAFALAQEAGMELHISTAVLRGAHPNTVLLRVRDAQGREMEVNASSLGGGRVRVNAIDGMEATFTGDYPTLIIRNQVRVRDAQGREMEVNASSLGGGRVRVNAIDGMEATFTGDYPTLIIRNQDKPGAVAEVTGVLSRRQVNIATMQLYRDKRGGLAVMVLESDQPIGAEAVEELRTSPGIVRVTYLDLKGGR